MYDVNCRRHLERSLKSVNLVVFVMQCLFCSVQCSSPICPGTVQHLLPGYVGEITALQLTALHYAVLNHTALHCTALHCTALHYTAPTCTALHCTALHCTALHCTALTFTVHYRARCWTWLQWYIWECNINLSLNSRKVTRTGRQPRTCTSQSGIYRTVQRRRKEYCGGMSYFSAVKKS